MPIPDFQTLMLPVLELASKGETSVPFAEAEASSSRGSRAATKVPREVGE